MGIFFGTDGIRGIACEELTHDLAIRCGNAVASTKEKAKIIIGRDTRTSGNYITNAFSVGAMGAGADIIDVGICSTPCIAYLTKQLKCDYGVIISASHNPPKYNGIKIFDTNGYKLGDEKENNLERKFINQKIVSYDKLGTYIQKFDYVNLYINHLKKCIKTNLNGLKIVLDTSNGATYKIAPKVFKSLGAQVVQIGELGDGKNINNNCGSLYPNALAQKVLLENANMGFAFDGDADRIIACDEKGNIIDGDLILYVLAKYLKQNNQLNNDVVVGTRHTNIAIENELKSLGLNFIRSDIGDKYVLEQMLKNQSSLGGEKSGHIILGNIATTGDGVLTALMLSLIVKTKNTLLSGIIDINLCPQANIDVVVFDKMKVINSEVLQNEINRQEEFLGKNSRVMVRVSGTEPKVRIMVETKNATLANNSAKQIAKTVKEIDGLMCIN